MRKTKVWCLGLLILIILHSAIAWAVEISVPADYSSIQTAIQIGKDGDIIVVQPGVYFESIQFLGKAIAVTSIDPNNPEVVASTIIDGKNENTVALFLDGEGHNSRLCGLTLQNGNKNQVHDWGDGGSSYLGGGIYCLKSSPTITKCLLKDNSGDGISCVQSSPLITCCKMIRNYYSGITCLLESSPVVTDCEFRENTGEGISCGKNSSPSFSRCICSHNGRGLVSHDSSPFLTDCLFMNNHGPGLLCEYPLSPTFIRCSIADNKERGVCLSEFSSPKIMNCLIFGNKFKGKGGGIYCHSSSPTIINCTICDNKADEGGDGMYCDELSFPVLLNSILWNSHSEIESVPSAHPCLNFCNIQGGYPGLGNIKDNPKFLSLVTADYRLGNESPCLDAGHPRIYDRDGSRSDLGAYGGEGGLNPDPVTIVVASDGTGDFSSIQDAIDYALYGDTVKVSPGLYAERLVITGKDISLISLQGADRTIIEGSSTGPVLSLCNLRSMAKVEGFCFQNGPKGGIYCAQASPLLIHCVIQKNLADHGAGIYCLYSSPSLTECLLTNNRADLGGGGMYAYHSSPILHKCVISHNSAHGQYDEGGGGVYSFMSAPSFHECMIENNTAQKDGGGIYSNSPAHGPMNIINCRIIENKAGDSGGGVHLCLGSYLTDEYFQNISQCVIANNSANKGGGIACWERSCIKIEDTKIIENDADEGGGVYCYGNASPSFVNCLMAKNSALKGGALYCLGDFNVFINFIKIHDISDIINLGWGFPKPKITHCTITENSASHLGGGIYFYLSFPQLTNCILWNDLPNEIFGYGLPLVSYSDIQMYPQYLKRYSGAGNINRDPLFVDPSHNDYHLKEGSPCIDKGIHILSPSNDLDGLPRPQMGKYRRWERCDMGAYEYSPKISDNRPIFFQ